PAPWVRALLNAGATGILLFLLWDVLAHAWEPVDAAVSADTYGVATGDGLVLAVGFAVGLLGLVYFDRLSAIRAGTAPAGRGAPAGSPATPATSATGPVSKLAATAAETSPVHLAMFIAGGIGLHSFAEGLAIGNSAANGEIALAVLLIVGFGLPNATEGS